MPVTVPDLTSFRIPIQHFIAPFESRTGPQSDPSKRRIYFNHLAIAATKKFGFGNTVLIFFCVHSWMKPNLVPLLLPCRDGIHSIFTAIIEKEQKYISKLS
jgi:hypothetical protein